MLQKLIGDRIFRCAIKKYEKDGIEIRFNLPQGISVHRKDGRDRSKIIQKSRPEPIRTIHKYQEL